MPIVTLAIYLGHIVFLFRNKDFFIKFIWVIAMMSWMVVANAILVIMPLWLNELQRTTYNNDSLLPLAVAVSLLLHCLLAFDSSYQHRRKHSDRPVRSLSRNRLTMIKAAGVLAFLVMLASFFAVLPHPSWLNESNRFIYAQAYLPSILRQYQTFLILLIPMAFPSFLAGMKRVFYATVALYVLYLIWTGEKFTSLFFLAYILLLCYFAANNKGFESASGKKAYKLIGRAAICAVAVFAALTAIQYIGMFGDAGSAFETFCQRIAAQGEVWWGTYDHLQNVPSELRVDELSDEYSSFFVRGDATDEIQQGGTYKLMRIVMTPDYYSSYIANSIRLTSSTPATFYYYFGFAGLLVAMAGCALVYGAVIVHTIKALSRIQIIESVILVYFVRALHGALIMSDFYELFSYRSLFLVLVLIGLGLIRKWRDSPKELKVIVRRTGAKTAN